MKAVVHRSVDMIKDNKFYSYGTYEGIPILNQKCPKCNNPLYINNGGDQCGIPFKGCTNEDCNYMNYKNYVRSILLIG